MRELEVSRFSEDLDIDLLAELLAEQAGHHNAEQAVDQREARSRGRSSLPSQNSAFVRASTVCSLAAFEDAV